MVYVHGGAWLELGNVKANWLSQGFMNVFLSLVYAAASVNYRLSTQAPFPAQLISLWLPAPLQAASAPAAAESQAPGPVGSAAPASSAKWNGGPVEFDRVVPPSGNMTVARRQFWLGPHRAGLTVTFWASTDIIHLMLAGARIKTLRSHLSTADLTALAASGRPAGPEPLPSAEPGAAIEVDRTVSNCGAVSLASRYVLAAEILGGRRVAIRIEQNTLMFFDPATRQLLRARPNPLTWEQARRLRGARPAGPRRAPPPSRSPSSAGPATPA